MQTVQDLMLPLKDGVLNIKTGVPATCGEQPKILCRRYKSKPSPTDPNITDISIYCRTAHEICSNCGHSSRPTAGVLPQSKAGHA